MALMLVDGNSIGYAAHHSPTLTCDGEEVQAIFHFLNIFRRMIREWPGYKPLVLWDGAPVARLAAYPEYKATRVLMPEQVERREAYQRQRPTIQKMLTHLGVTQVTPTMDEADDAALMFYEKIRDHKDQRLLLITGDRDWLQLVRDENVIWHDPRMKDGKTVRLHTFEDFTGFANWRQYLQGKALIGDVSDNIIGIDGIGIKGAQAIARNGSVDDLILMAPYSRKEELPQDLRRYFKVINRFCTSPEEVKRFDLNLELLKMRSPDPSTVRLQRGVKNMEKFYDECHELQFFSITRNIDQWDILA